MKMRDYFSSKAVSLCFCGIAALCWGAFAYIAGASPVLLWGSEIIFVAAVILRYSAGYAATNARLKKLKRNNNGHNIYLM